MAIQRRSTTRGKVPGSDHNHNALSQTGGLVDQMLGLESLSPKSRENGPGKLYVVSLGIGNLDDVSSRAISTLLTVDYVLAEDTRQIHKFLKLKDLPKLTTTSYRDQIHDKVAPKIIRDLKSGKHIALVSDRGTPTISDPGFKLVRDVREEDLEVVSVPGPAAIIAALSISGLPTDRFSFLGFLPRKSGKQQQILKQFGELPATFIAYESPYRVRKLLENIREALGEIDVVVAKELTKMNEEVSSGTPSELLELLPTELKGEWVVLGRK